MSLRCVNEVCDSDLIAFMVEDIQLDLCPICKGFWFDTGEIERCIQKAPRKIQVAFGEIAMSGVAEGLKGQPRKCPHCQTLMEKERYEGGVWIDKCPQGHGIWLDSGEMAAIYGQARAKGTAGAGGGPAGGGLGELLGSIIRAFTKK